MCKLYEHASQLLAAQSGAAPIYDLLIRGGRLIDPSQGFSAETDIGIRQGKIARLAPNIPESASRQVLDARKMIVTPGLVDVHVHVYDGVAPPFSSCTLPKPRRDRKVALTNLRLFRRIAGRDG